MGTLIDKTKIQLQTSRQRYESGFRIGRVRVLKEVKVFTAEELKSGTYTLEAQMYINDKILKTSEELNITSAFNTLKGTVITAEDGSGQALQVWRSISL